MYDDNGNLIIDLNKNASNVAGGVTTQPSWVFRSFPISTWQKMSATERWAANTKFLDRMIARGDKIVLSNRVIGIDKVTGIFRKELDYLIEKGYKISSDGFSQ